MILGGFKETRARSEWMLSKRGGLNNLSLGSRKVKADLVREAMVNHFCGCQVALPLFCLYV